MAKKAYSQGKEKAYSRGRERTYSRGRKKAYSRRRRKRLYRRIMRLGCLAVLLAASAAFLFAAGRVLWDLLDGEPADFQEVLGMLADPDDGDLEERKIPLPELSDLHSSCAVLAEASTGEILTEYHGEKQIYPASLTKMMTALLAAERTDSLDELIVLPDEIFPPLYAEDASMAGFLPGEEVTARDLLYGILLPSGAECCQTFARRISGSEEAFAELMNERARELGMTHTHFCNCTGLHDPEHYSTAEDLKTLLCSALKNEAFREAFTSRRYSTGPSNLHPDGITIYSTMFQSLEREEVTGGRILGGKTGYTQEAGLCLASLAEVNGREYILITAGAEGDHNTQQFHTMDALTVYDRLGQEQGEG